jgi:hypothetical protein
VLLVGVQGRGRGIKQNFRGRRFDVIRCHVMGACIAVQVFGLQRSMKFGVWGRFALYTFVGTYGHFLILGGLQMQCKSAKSTRSVSIVAAELYGGLCF